MRKYINPELMISVFDQENICTTSGYTGESVTPDSGQSVLDKVKANAQHVATVDFMQFK